MPFSLRKHRQETLFLKLEAMCDRIRSHGGKATLTYLSDVERGLRKPAYWNLLPIAAAYGVSVDDVRRSCGMPLPSASPASEELRT
jgi:hypothetical protein